MTEPDIPSDHPSVVNRPVRPELGLNRAVFFELGRGRMEGTAVDGKFPSPAVPGHHRPTSIDDLPVIIHNRYSVIIRYISPLS